MRNSGIILARELDGGRYRLSGDTFSKKDAIKELGGRWDGKHWTVPESALKEIGARKEVLLRLAPHCHTPSEVVWGDEIDVKRGTKLMGCSYCDTPYFSGQQVKIIEVIDAAF